MHQGSLLQQKPARVQVLQGTAARVHAARPVGQVSQETARSVQKKVARLFRKHLRAQPLIVVAVSKSYEVKVV